MAASTTFNLTLGNSIVWDRPEIFDPERQVKYPSLVAPRGVQLPFTDTRYSYGAVSINVPPGGSRFKIRLSPGNNPADDPVLFVWDQTFNNPAGGDPTGNSDLTSGLLVMNDDDQYDVIDDKIIPRLPASVSLFPEISNLSLPEGTYWLVVSAFKPEDRGDVEITVEGDVVVTPGGTGLVPGSAVATQADGTTAKLPDATAVASPEITSATYDGSTGTLVVTGTSFTANAGSDNDVDVSKLTISGGSTRSPYTLTSGSVEITSPTSFSINLNEADKKALLQILNKDGSASKGGKTYNLAAAAGWLPGSTAPADLAGNLITASNSDSTPPTFVSSTLSSTAASASIAEQIDLQFSEEVQAGIGNILIQKQDGTVVQTIRAADASQVVVRGNDVIINPTQNLDFSTTYQVVVEPNAFYDLAKNAFAGLSGSSLSFTTGASKTASITTGTTPGKNAPVISKATDKTVTPNTGLPKLADKNPVIPSGTTIDANKDGTPDSQQANVTPILQVNGGTQPSNYGAVEVKSRLNLVSVSQTKPGVDGTLAVNTRNNQLITTTIPRGTTNATNGVISFDVSGLTPGESTVATIHFPESLALQEGDAYVKFNYITEQYEEYVDSSGNRLYRLIDSNGDGTYDAAEVTLIDGDQAWDRDGEINGVVDDNGFLVYDQRTLNGSKKRDVIIGNLLENTIRGRKGNDRIYGEASIDVLIGNAGKDKYFYASATESEAFERDSVKFRSGDKFVFRGFDADLTQDGIQKPVFIGKRSFTGSAGEFRATRSVLEADLNGDGLSDFAINLTGKTPLTAGSFVF